MKKKNTGNKRYRDENEKQKTSKKKYKKEYITELAKSLKGLKKDFDTYKNNALINYKIIDEKIEVLKREIFDIKRENIDIKRDIMNMKRDNMDIKRDNMDIKNDIMDIKRENMDIKRDIMDIKRDNIYLNNKNKFFEIKITSNRHEIDKLNSKVQKLQKDFADFEKFYFPDRLRKLLKVMLKYIIEKYYKHYMIYDKSERKLLFFKVPKIPMKLKATNAQIISSLNELLGKIFIICKIKDNCIHFYDPRTIFNDSFKKEFIVFKDYTYFCHSLDISEDAQKILFYFIPEIYFTKINNYTIEENISNILDKIDD